MAKKIIEEIIDDKIFGYRAPCFSLTNNTLSKLHSIGFRYDSSYIEFSNHNLYSELNMSRFNRLNSILLKSKNTDFLNFKFQLQKYLI